MKSFREELLRFQQKLAAHEPFALARFGDGEMVILMGDHPNRARRVAGTRGPLRKDRLASFAKRMLRCPQRGVESGSDAQRNLMRAASMHPRWRERVDCLYNFEVHRPPGALAA